VPPRYKPVEDCRAEIEQYIGQLEAGTDDADPESRDSRSTRRYKQDLRWYDHWLDDAEIESVTTVTPADANSVGQQLADEFNGTTKRSRWDRIYAFHSWLKRMELTDSNPYEKWNDEKEEIFGLSKATEQSRHLQDEEEYAVSQEDVRLMEQNVSRHRIRDQLIIRMMWQSGIRRSEAAGLLESDIDRNELEITIRKANAKNGEQRIVAYQKSLDGLLGKWLDEGYREEMAAGRDHEKVFVGERGAPISGDRINDIVIDAAYDAGINRKIYADANAPVDEDGNREPNRWKITSHNIRHGFGTYMVNDTDAGLWEVSRQMGHSSVKVTEDIYVEDDPRAGVEDTHKYGPD